MQLNQVKALVTGGVSGLGLATVRHIIANGGKAVMLDINDDAGAVAEAELGAKYIRTDVTSEAGVVDAVEQAVAAIGGLNAAVNCAGIIGAGSPVRHRDDLVVGTRRGRRQGIGAPALVAGAAAQDTAQAQRDERRDHCEEDDVEKGKTVGHGALR